MVVVMIAYLWNDEHDLVTAVSGGLSIAVDS